MAPTHKYNEKMSDERTNAILQTENAFLKGKLSQSKMDVEVLKLKLEKEVEEHRELKTTLAVRDEFDREMERVRYEQNSSLLECTMRIEALEQENNYLSLMKHADDDMKSWEKERAELLATFEETNQKLMAENESLKKQKEDIANHAKNSETLFTTRIGILIAEIDRLRAESKSEDRESKVVEEMQTRVETLGSKLNDAMDAIEEIEDENNTLRDRLDDYIEKKMKLEADMQFQKEFHSQEQRVYLEDCQKFETQIGNLNEEMTLLEEARDALRREIAELNEKQTQLTITFANEKAKFCHDMERVEEKWNTEVVKLREQNDQLEELVFTSAKETLDKKAFFEEETRKLKERVGELEIALTMTTKGSEREVEALRDEIHVLNSQLEETRSSKDKTIHEFDSECVALEVEVFNLLEKRRTETKRIKTLERKNNWLSKSIKDLAEQRREEIEAMDKEIRILADRCELLRKEKEMWLAELRKEINAWKEDTAAKMELNKKIEELELEKGELEEKVANVTEAWRRESTIYEENIAAMREKETTAKKESTRHIEDLQHELTDIVNRMNELDYNKRMTLAELATERSNTMVLKEMVNSSKTEIDKMRLTMISEKRSMTKKHEEAIEKMNGMIECMKHNADYDKTRMREANQLIDSLEYKIANMTMCHDVDRQFLRDEIGRLKSQYNKVKDDMGVEELDDVEADSSDDNTSECSCHECEQIEELDDGDDVYEDMPELKDERVGDKKEKTAVDEWELVEEDDRL